MVSLILFVPIATTGAVKKGGTLVVGLVAEPTSLDPGQPTDQNTIGRIHPNIHETLVRYAEDGFDVVPHLATSWKISEDGLLYTFQLRAGVKFHDGTPFNAEAVKFSFERMLNKEHPYYHTGPFPFAGFWYGRIKQIEVNDPLTVTFTLSEPYTPFLGALAIPTGSIVSPAAVQKWGKDFAKRGGGTGPFMVQEWKQNVELILAKNPEYWNGVPNLDRVIYRPIVEEQARLTELLSGGIDLTTDLPPDNIEQIKKDPQLVYKDLPGPHVWFLNLNLSGPPFNDIRVRHAVAYAINKAAIVKDILKGTATVAHSVIPEAFREWHNPHVPPYAYDPAKAKQLLDEAGLKDPDGDGPQPRSSILFLVTESGSGMLSPKTMGQAIQADLAAVGIQANIEVLEWGAYLHRYNAGLAKEPFVPMAEMSWFYGHDPDIVPYLILHKNNLPPAFNASYYVNDRVSELLDKARKITNKEERQKLYFALQEIVSRDLPMIFIASQVQTAAMSKAVKDFRLHPSFEHRYHKVWVEK
jgi:peptide/nickel transport system substrate-binding protein